MRNAFLALMLMTSCSFEPAEPEAHFRALAWAEVEASLPRLAGSHELERSQTPEVLGAVLCLESGQDLEAQLRGAGWKIDSLEAIGEQRLDVTASRGAFILTGSLTQDPREGCATGFTYAVRKEVAP